MSFDAKTDTPSSIFPSGAKIPFGDPVADGWDTIGVEKTLEAIAVKSDNASAVRALLNLQTRESFNVKDYGAIGDARHVDDGVCNGTTVVTSATANFTNADVGKVIFGVEAGGPGLVRLTKTTIVSRTDSTTIVVGATAGSAVGVTLVWGTDDTAALQAAFAAADAVTPDGEVVIPPGGYIVTAKPFNYTGTSGPTIRGAGSRQVTIYLTTDYAVGTAGDGVINTNANMVGLRVSGLRIDGCAQYDRTAFSGIADKGVETRLTDLYIRRLGNQGVGLRATGSRAAIYDQVIAVECWVGIYCLNQVGANFYSCGGSNCNGYSWWIQNCRGTTSNDGTHVVIFGGTIDESTAGSLIVENSDDVCLIGVRAFGAVSFYAVELTSNSVVRAVGCELIDWSTSGNRGGVKIGSGSTFMASLCRLSGRGTLFALDRAGTFVDGGGNTIGGTGTTGAGQGQLRAASLSNGAASATGTLANAPTAGNPTKWIPINDAGTVRYIPAW